MPKPIPRKAGGWLLQVSAGKDAQGQRVRYTEVFHGSHPEAKLRLAAMQLEATQRRGGRCPTLADYATEFLARAAKTKSPVTVRWYEKMLRARILPALGHHPLEKLTRRHGYLFIKELETWERQDRVCDAEGIAHQRAGALSPASQRHYYRVLHLLLQDAVHRGVIPANPLATVEAPRAPRREARYYTEDDLVQLLTALGHEPLCFRVLITLALTTGLRRGELIALEWGDVDARRQRLTVARSAYAIAGHGQQSKAPKTHAGARSVPLTADSLALLQHWRDLQAADRARLGDAWQGGAHLATTPAGRWLSLHEFSHQFAAFITRHGLPEITLHGLRHTAASLLLAGGIAVKAVSALLGHAQASTTLDIYGHVLTSAQDQARAVMQQAMASPLASTNATPPAPEAETR